MEQEKKIVFFHLLNDFSGSPKVLSQVIKIAKRSNTTLDLYTSKSEGFLSDIENINVFDIKYKLVRQKWLILLRLLFSQIRLLFILRKYKNKNTIFYVNTLLPFGAALAGKLYGIKVIYHLHETSISPQIWKKFLLFIVTISAEEVIYVSNYLKNKEPIKNKKCSVVYNAISEDFMGLNQINNNNKTILMACSLKKYKGINEFISLAENLHQLNFKLVLNATKQEINEYFNSKKLPKNLQLYPKQKSLHTFYKESSLVLNLSIPATWIETFGLTIIEAMAYGIPTIVPIIGGPAEIIQHGENGYTVDSQNTTALEKTIIKLFTDKTEYKRISNGAYNAINRFSFATFQTKINKILTTY